MENRLAAEKSPYLLQHAENPVDWHPWGDEAFAKARREGKPVFLSIGYATCHWCHVMAHESFEDKEVAAILNRAFVPIKVDREERPDIDQIYMSVCQGLTGSGGWPLTIFMTPDRKPFFAGTYFPKTPRMGLPGFMDLAGTIARLWKMERRRLEKAGEDITNAIAAPEDRRTDTELPGEDLLKKGISELSAAFDLNRGGFGTAPKFPSPHQITFLLRMWRRTGDPGTRAMAEKTLHAMRNGGIFDQVGFGFHRYSVDERWLVPHFEKMLYDQATLITAYSEAWQAFKIPLYEKTVREIAEYVLRDLTSPSGAFYCAEDADSEGKEGTFYIWEPDEISAILGQEDAGIFMRFHGVTKEGNFEGGKSVLHVAKDVESLAGTLGMDPAALAGRIERSRKRLFNARSRRPRPLLDDKIIASWNGLMIGGLARASRALGVDEWARKAATAASAVLGALRRDDSRLFRRIREGERRYEGCLDDYAYLAHGLLELFEATGDPLWLKEAHNLTTVMMEDFFDEDRGMLSFSSSRVDDLIARAADTHDGALPSATSVAVMNLLRLARMTGRTGIGESAIRILAYHAGELKDTPSGYTHMLSALDFAISPGTEAVVAGNGGEAIFEAMLARLRRQYLPRMVLLVKDLSSPGDMLGELAPFTRPMGLIRGGPAAYLCHGGACMEPVTDLEAL